MRQTKYISGYGYISGGGLSDIINLMKGVFNRLPPSVIQATKKAATSAATAGITTAGDRVGSELANRIAPKKPKSVPKEAVLKDLKLSSNPQQDISQLGFGRRKVRGKGIKILK